MGFLVFYFTTSCLKMSLSWADGEDHRKLERHCFAFLHSSRCGLAPCLVSKKGKYGVSSLLDVWVQPEMMWVRAWPQHLHKALPVLPLRWRKGQVFPLVSLILKECGVPSDTGETPQIYNRTHTSRSGKEQREFGHILKPFWVTFFLRSVRCRCFLFLFFFPRKRWNKIINGASK